jgi:hypothetical protein
VINLANPLVAVDGIPLNDGDRVLLKDQVPASENGIYDWDSGTQLLSRAVDFFQPVDVTCGLLVTVEEGPTHGDTLWQLATDNPITVGVTNLAFTQIASGGGGSAHPRRGLGGGPVTVTALDGVRVFFQEPIDPTESSGFTTFVLGVVISVSNALLTGRVRLWNLNDGEFVTGTTLTTSATTPTVVESVALTVGAAAGNLKNSLKTYELWIDVLGGVGAADTVTVGSSYLKVTP